MHGVLALMLALAPTLGGVQRSAPGECLGSEPAVTVQIHIYSHVPSESLSRASDIVTRLYGRIGVRTVWFGVVPQGRLRAQVRSEAEVPRFPVAQITIIMLTPEMAARGHIPEDVLGYAAVADDGMGRIAYVVYDRVRQVASEAKSNEGDMLGYVMAHEMGHLFLGHGSQAENGLMRGHWDRRELQQVDPLSLEFSPREAEQIRSMLESNPASPRAVATAGRSTDETCIVPRDDQAAH